MQMMVRQTAVPTLATAIIATTARAHTRTL